MCRHKACDEIILECLYCPLCGLASIEMRWDELEELMLIVYVVFDKLQTFIVKNV